MSSHDWPVLKKRDGDSRNQEQKTYVLIHGAYHGGWCWKEVAERLRACGHTVYTPTQTGLGERSHLLWTKPTMETLIEDVVQVFRYEELEDVILVGHSFGGSTVSALADRIPEKLRHLVYLDAMLLHSGEAPMDRLPPEWEERYRTRAKETNGLSVAPSDPAHFGVTDPKMGAWLASKMTPHPFQLYLDKLELKHPLGNGLPTTYIACSKPFFSNLAKSREIAKEIPGWTYLEIPTGHNAMMLEPLRLTALLGDVG